MKTKLLSLAFVVALIGCGETKVEDNATEGHNTTPVTSEIPSDEEMLKLDLVSSIVTKGGAKAADQLLIEEMLSGVNETKSLDTWEAKAVGHWVGNFGDNKINISITRIKDGKVEGFSGMLIKLGGLPSVTQVMVVDRLGTRMGRVLGFLVERPI